MELLVAIEPSAEEVDLVFLPGARAGQKHKSGDKEALTRERPKCKEELAKLLAKSFQLGREYESDGSE